MREAVPVCLSISRYMPVSGLALVVSDLARPEFFATVRAQPSLALFKIVILVFPFSVKDIEIHIVLPACLEISLLHFGACHDLYFLNALDHKDFASVRVVQNEVTGFGILVVVDHG